MFCTLYHNPLRCHIYYGGEKSQMKKSDEQKA